MYSRCYSLLTLSTVPAAFGLVAACILVPASLLLARFGRTWSRWAMVHWIINTATVVFVCIAVALAHLGKDKNKSVALDIECSM